MREKLTTKYLESLLRSKGVSYDHIKIMKKTRNRSDVPMCWYYREGPTKENQRIPVNDIRGLGDRGTPSRSWFSHGLWHRKSDMDTKRILKAILALENQPLHAFQQFYEEEPVRLIYYPGIGYFVNGDGTHRTLFAKLTNCSHVLAHVEYPVIEEEKHQFCQRYSRSFTGFFHVHYARLINPYSPPPDPIRR